MNKEDIKALALTLGFHLKQQPDGQMDLNPYVYQFAMAIRAADPTPPAQDAIKALEPFAEIGAWLFARNLPDETPVVEVNGINGVTWALTRGHFKAAHTAYSSAPPASEVEPVGVVKWWNVGGSGKFYKVQWTLPVPQDGSKLYTHPANDELRKAIKSITDLLRNREWVERVSSDTDVIELESQITALHGELSGLRKALDILERLSGIAMMEDDPVRVAARTILARYQGVK